MLDAADAMTTRHPHQGRPTWFSSFLEWRAPFEIISLAGYTEQEKLAIARRYRDLVAQIAIDQGGADRCSETRMQLIRRFASGAVLAEELEARLARGEPVDIAEHALLSSTLVRLAQRIGLERRAKPVLPTVKDYLEHVEAAE